METIKNYIAAQGGAVFVVSQVFSIIATVLLLLSYQQKTHKRIVMMQAVSGLLFGTQYLMIGAFEGMMCNYIGMVRAITYSFRNKSKAVDSVICPAFFAIAFIISGIFTYESPLSLLPSVAMVFSSFVMWIPKTQELRALSLPTCAMWLIYNIKANALVAIFTEVFNILSIFIALLRFSKFAKNRKSKTNGGM